MNGRRVCQLLLLFAALGASGAAMARGGGGGHGGGWGGGGWGGGGYHGGGWGGGSIGLYFGPGLYGYPYPYAGYGYPYAAYPYSSYYPGYPYGPTADGVSSSNQYVEQGQDGQADAGPGAAPQASYWYQCRNPEGYYPYVRTCPGGWQRVPAQPPG
jgi:hypothetical protein